MSKRLKKEEIAAKYKNSFDDIIGDPYAYPEPKIGTYEGLKQRSTINAVQISPDTKSPSPVNKAKPNQLDFFVDVENAVMDGLAAYAEKSVYTLDVLMTMFDNTYWLEHGVIFTQQERAEIEQQVGRILYARKISPSTKYFTTIRK